MLWLWLLGCAGVRDYFPQGPVVGQVERLAALSGERAPEVRYVGSPVVPFPVAPLQVFGVSYDVDLVLRTRHPDWDMHEYARIETPDGPLWLAKDARAPGKTQSIVADVEHIEGWWPEVPVERKRGEVVVEDRSAEGWLDLDLRYENLDGEPVWVSFEGPMAEAPMKKRNGSTFGHSADSLVAVLDVSHRAFARRASVTIGGERQRLVKVAGLVPLKVALAQTQAGYSAGSWSVSAAGDGVQTVHAGELVQRWAVVRGRGWTDLVQDGELRRIRYHFLDEDGTLSLASATVRQHAQATEALHMAFVPALPDLRRPFDGEISGRWVIDVGGQPGHAVGTWTARWLGETAWLSLRGEAPAWVADRPVDVGIRFEEGVATVEARRVGGG
jgi:hypothetical protein